MSAKMCVAMYSKDKPNSRNEKWYQGHRMFNWTSLTSYISVNRSKNKTNKQQQEEENPWVHWEGMADTQLTIPNSSLAYFHPIKFKNLRDRQHTYYTQNYTYTKHETHTRGLQLLHIHTSHICKYIMHTHIHTQTHTTNVQMWTMPGKQ